jgi:hypothetical protein
MTVALLRAKLGALDVPATGKKAELVSRLTEALLAAGPAAAVAKGEEEEEEEEEEEMLANTTAAAAVLPATPVKVGTLHLGQEASARRAAREKLRAGEKRAVEHVALHADEAGDEDGEEEETLDVLEEVTILPSGGLARKRTRKSKQENSKREWAAEVAVPGSVGLMDDILALET